MPGPFLVGYDASEAAQAALRMAAERALALSRKVILLTVVPPGLTQAAFTQFLIPTLQVPHTRKDDTYLVTARKNLEAVAEEIRRQGVEVEAVVREGDAADEMILLAQEIDADQLWLGFKSFEKRVPYGLGSTADKVLRYSDRTVTVVRPR